MRTTTSIAALQSALTLVIGLAVALPTAVSADVFGVYAGGAIWSQDIDGSAVSTTDAVAGVAANAVDLQDDLGFADKRRYQLYAGLEHPLPLLPNLRVDYTKIAQNADGVLSRNIEFNGRSFSFSADVLSEVDLEQTDLVLYYELLDNDLVEIDLGLGARYLDGFVSIADASGSSSAEFEGVIPLAYVGTRVQLPLTGLSVAGQLRGLSYKDDSLIDANATLAWQSDLGLGVEMGYRIMELEIDEFDEIDSADLTVKGPYAGFSFRF